MKTISEEEYIIENGGESMLGISTPCAKMAGQSKSHIREIQSLLKTKMDSIQENRNRLRDEYRKKVDAGEVRKPTNEEELIKRANGNPENASVQAARRCCLKRGINWQ